MNFENPNDHDKALFNREATEVAAREAAFTALEERLGSVYDVMSEKEKAAAVVTAATELMKEFSITKEDSTEAARNEMRHQVEALGKIRTEYEKLHHDLVYEEATDHVELRGIMGEIEARKTAEDEAELVAAMDEVKDLKMILGKYDPDAEPKKEAA